VVLYAATGGSQPPLSRQRAVVRVRRGGPAGRVGVEKIAIAMELHRRRLVGHVLRRVCPGGSGRDAGRDYAVEFESIENPETLHDT